MKKADAIAPALIVSESISRLGQLYVLGSWSLGSTAFGVGHALTFTKLVVAHAVEARRVKKHVFTGAGCR